MRFFSQSQSVAMQNRSNREITFDTQFKTALLLAGETQVSDWCVSVRVLLVQFLS